VLWIHQQGVVTTEIVTIVGWISRRRENTSLAS